MSILISIIIPAYNRADVIGDALESIMKQTYTHWECIVVDDGSTDNTEALVKSYVQKDSRIRLYNRPKCRPKGGNAARNYGLEKSKGQLVNWVDSDDKLTPEHLQVHLRAHSEVIIEASVSQAVTFNDIFVDLVHNWSNIYPKNDIIGEMMDNKTLWPIGGVVWEKSKLPVNPFDESLASSQEWTFHLKMLSDTLSYTLIDEVTYLARGHSERKNTNPPEAKIRSTAASRFKIYTTYYTKKLLNPEREHILLQTLCTTVKDALDFKYYNTAFFTLKGLCRIFFKSRYKLKLARVIFLATIIYLFTGKGYRLFKL
jgi:glycosyltransferase involved in cell wall biosynthesis